MKMRLFGVVLTILASFAQAPAALFTTNIFLGAADLTYENQPVAVSGCVLTLEGAHTFQSLQLTNGAVLRHVAAPNGEANRQVSLVLTGDLLVDGTSRVDADGLGFGAGAGPGAGNSSSTNWGTGAGHGGLGGMGSGALAGGPSYGSAANPTQNGSGGGNGYLSFGGSGGGVIRITVAGSALINGNLTANGLAGWGSTLAGGGSGGSVYLSVGQLVGFGILSAKGGGAVSGGGGAGGRLTVVCGNYDFHGRYWAYGGAGREYGGAGTIYFQTSSIPELVLDNGGSAGALTPLQPMPNVNLAIGNFAAAYPVTGVSNANLTIRSNGWLTHLAGQASLSIAVATNLVVEAGGRIDVTGKGYVSATGPGAGASAGMGATVQGGGGGGHGGSGGDDLMGGDCHDSLLHPKQYGSGGGDGFLSYGGYGGGCVEIKAGRTVRIDGILAAGGGDSFGYILGGGGAGGSLTLEMTTLSGSGVISASGGRGAAGEGGGGGGGRIAAYYRTNLFAGVISAVGGAGGTKGGAGTIYYKAALLPHGRLIVDNGGVAGGLTQLNPAFWPEESFFDLTLSGAARLLVETPLTFGDVLVASGAVVTHPPGTRTLQLVALGDAIFNAGTRVTANGLGHTAGSGTGVGGTSGNWEGGGGGYGGAGGGTTNGAPGGIVYGSAAQPLEFGSGGGAGYLSSGGAGGGLIQLSAGRILQLDGEVTANGEPAPNLKGGGGAGGSIFLTAGILTGSGVVAAQGGAAVLGGGGGGGRIALYGGLIVDFSTPPSVAGGLSGSGAHAEANGKAGTIYKSTNFPPFQVVGMSPTNFVPQAVGGLRIAFNTGIDSNSIAAANVSIQTPSGFLPQNQVTITPAGGPWFTIGFPVQTAAGTYTVKIGPGIRNLQGELMDQNGNGVRGETPQDVFSGTFKLGPSVTLSGTVRLAGNVPVPNVRVQAGTDAVAITDAAGQYALVLPQNWSGTVTPSKLGAVMLPASRTYASLAANLAGQDYTVTLTFAPTLKTALQGSALRLEWLSVPGIRYQIRTATDLTDWQDAGLPLLGTGGVLYWAIDTAGNPRTFVRVLANN